MLKLVTSMACILMFVGIATTVFAENGANQNEFMTGEAIVENKIENVEENRIEQFQIQASRLENTPVLKDTEQKQIEETFSTEPTVEETIALETIAEETEEIVPEETVAPKMTESEKKVNYHTGVLTARKGYVTDSPCGPNGNDGYETWYPTHPGGAVKILEKQCGFTNLKLEVCREEGPRYGVRIISGTMPNGESFENLIVVAADIICESNPTGVFERGQFIETSLGPGLIVDFCERAVNERKYNGRTHIDLATNWYN